MPHPKMPEGVPRETDLFLSSSITPQNRTKPNLTQNTLGPSGRDWRGLTSKHPRGGSTGKREEEAESRGKRCPPAIEFQRFQEEMACSASEKSFGRGPCPKWPARREHCPTVGDPTGRQARRAPDADRVAGVASGKRPVGNEGSVGLFFRWN